MPANLNFEAEPFGGFSGSHGESSEEFETVVRDHRAGYGGGPVIRDHRGGYVDASVARDYRGRYGGTTVSVRPSISSPASARTARPWEGWGGRGGWGGWGGWGGGTGGRASWAPSFFQSGTPSYSGALIPGGIGYGPPRWRFRTGFRRRWPWLSQGGFGFDPAPQDPQTVAWAQACLAHIVGAPMRQDGLLGPDTRRAIQTFQTQMQLPPSGALDNDTLVALQQVCQADAGGDDAGAPSSPQAPAQSEVSDFPHQFVGGPSEMETPTKKSVPPPRVSPMPVWPTRPLPPSENGRFIKALADLEVRVNASSDPRKWRYQCWLAKLKQSGVDDRVIRWGAICPTVGVIPTVVGACDIASGWLGPEGAERLWKNIRKVRDVDAAGPSLGIITYLKSDIVVSFEMTALPLDNLRLTHDEVQRAIEKLGKWADLESGGSSGMPTEYVSIKDWIGERQRDAKSVYSCM
jgi:hypothetical protein